jgi:hypothetical protein
MKFSEDTFSVLKNFSQINPSIAFKAGNVLRTISPQKTVMASAVVDDTFERNACVYDLSRFYTVISAFDDDVDINFGDSAFVISDSKSQVIYTYASESMIVTPPAKDIDNKEAFATVDVKWADITKVLRMAAVLGLPEISFNGDGTNIYLSAVDKKNPTADKYKATLDSVNATSEPFDVSIKVEHLKLLESDYRIKLCSTGVAHLISKNEKVQYWIAISV